MVSLFCRQLKFCEMNKLHGKHIHLNKVSSLLLSFVIKHHIFYFIFCLNLDIFIRLKVLKNLDYCNSGAETCLISPLMSFSHFVSWIVIKRRKSFDVGANIFIGNLDPVCILYILGNYTLEYWYFNYN